MAQIKSKFIEANAVDDTKIKLRNNNNLKARNAADNADVNILKVNASDRIEFASVPQASGAPATGNDLVNKTYADSLSGAVASVNGATGVVVLDTDDISEGSTNKYQKTWAKASFTLNGTDITNQYKDFSHVAVTDSVDLIISGVVQIEGVDYTLDYTGGSGGNTRLTFAGDLATGGAAELISGDILRVKYQR